MQTSAATAPSLSLRNRLAIRLLSRGAEPFPCWSLLWRLTANVLHVPYVPSAHAGSEARPRGHCPGPFPCASRELRSEPLAAGGGFRRREGWSAKV